MSYCYDTLPPKLHKVYQTPYLKLYVYIRSTHHSCRPSYVLCTFEEISRIPLLHFPPPRPNQITYHHHNLPPTPFKLPSKPLKPPIVRLTTPLLMYCFFIYIFQHFSLSTSDDFPQTVLEAAGRIRQGGWSKGKKNLDIYSFSSSCTNTGNL